MLSLTVDLFLGISEELCEVTLDESELVVRVHKWPHPLG